MFESYLLVAVVGVVFSTGVLVHKVNNHDKRLDVGDKKLDRYSEMIVSANTSIEDMKGDLQEIKKDVKMLIKNGKKE